MLLERSLTELLTPEVASSSRGGLLWGSRGRRFESGQPDHRGDGVGVPSVQVMRASMPSTRDDIIRSSGGQWAAWDPLVPNPIYRPGCGPSGSAICASSDSDLHHRRRRGFDTSSGGTDACSGVLCEREEVTVRIAHQELTSTPLAFLDAPLEGDDAAQFVLNGGDAGWV